MARRWPSRALLIGALAAACTSAVAPTTTATRASGSPTAAPVGTEPASAIASLLPSATDPRPDPVIGASARPLGALRGDVVFVLRKSAGTGEVWAVPLGGGPAVLAVRYVAPSGPNRPDQNALRKQLSPDGTHIVLNVAAHTAGGGTRRGLVSVDLSSGVVTPIGRDDNDEDTQPAWSPDGTQLAYVRVRRDQPVFDDGVWVMDAAGRSARRITAPTQGAWTVLYEWLPDGSALAVGTAWEQLTYYLIDARNGAIMGAQSAGATVPAQSVRDTAVPTGYQMTNWRRGSPSFILAFNSGGYTPTVFGLVVADAPRGPWRVLTHVDVNPTSPAYPPTPSSPRWRPSSAEAVYRLGEELHVIDTASAKDTPVRTAQIASLADWTPNGDEIVYATSPDPGPGAARAPRVRVIRPDGNQDRILADLSADLSHLIC